MPRETPADLASRLEGLLLNLPDDAAARVLKDAVGAALTEQLRAQLGGELPLAPPPPAPAARPQAVRRPGRPRHEWPDLVLERDHASGAWWLLAALPPDVAELRDLARVLDRALRYVTGLAEQPEPQPIAWYPILTGDLSHPGDPAIGADIEVVDYHLGVDTEGNTSMARAVATYLEDRGGDPSNPVDRVRALDEILRGSIAPGEDDTAALSEVTTCRACGRWLVLRVRAASPTAGGDPRWHKITNRNRRYCNARCRARAHGRDKPRKRRKPPRN